jgi:thiamine biosynthesis protein ThiS
MPEKTPSLIEIRANDQTYQVRDGLGLEEFLRSLEMEPAHLVVEHNGEAVSPGEKAAIRLRSGDRLELVQIVAGG